MRIGPITILWTKTLENKDNYSGSLVEKIDLLKHQVEQREQDDKELSVIRKHDDDLRKTMIKHLTIQNTEYKAQLQRWGLDEGVIKQGSKKHE